MKYRCLVVGGVMTLLDFLVLFFLKQFTFQIILLLFINLIGITLLYFWLIGPIREMHRQMEKMEKENRQLEKVRKEFVANVSHELKTPLTSISGFIETLQDGAIEDKEIRTRFIDIIAIETSRLERLIGDILVLSDIEEKKEEPQQDFMVKEEMGLIIAVMKPIADNRHIRILEDLDETITINGSKDRFQQMMVNLIENAIKYSNEGGSIWITGKKEKGKVVLSVADEGIGISEENLKRLFERFYRVDKSRSKKVGGTGLGLSIVKHVAALFNAKVHVESKLGEGSTFYIIFEQVENASY